MQPHRLLADSLLVVNRIRLKTGSTLSSMSEKGLNDKIILSVNLIYLELHSVTLVSKLTLPINQPHKNKYLFPY